MATDKKLKENLKKALEELTSAMMSKQNACAGIGGIIENCGGISVDDSMVSNFLSQLSGGKAFNLKDSLNHVKEAINGIYEGNSQKSTKLIGEFNKFENANFKDYKGICNGIIQEINKDKKHIVGVQAGIVRWCKGVVKKLEKGSKKAEKAVGNPMAFAEDLGNDVCSDLF